MINEQPKTTKHLLCMYQWERDYGAENESAVVSSVISKHLPTIIKTTLWIVLRVILENILM